MATLDVHVSEQEKAYGVTWEQPIKPQPALMVEFNNATDTDLTCLTARLKAMLKYCKARTKVDWQVFRKGSEDKLALTLSNVRDALQVCTLHVFR
jgi:hypothetical protein